MSIDREKDCALLNELKQDLVFQDNLLGTQLTFNTTWGIFSPRGIDDGTHLLLKYLEVEADETIIDIGCGYGPLGLALGGQAPDGEVHMVDRDYVAVEYANKNAKINRMSHCRAYTSNGFSEVPESMRFDTVVSNVPAKVGREMLTILLCDARSRMNPGGQIVVVTINGLRDFIKRNFKEVFGNYKKLKQGKAYTVARAIME
ncbi:MAG: class I SAM-dependent methyltransferase [Gammaproteobacteria bacterium]|uniref:Class I SAM-dependent methyltransferase n=1 Tax=Candidatus Thiopontia autotrophica TaxID=2841688 RepID=A0A8J6P8Z7_9GAMM|nr:class I SAM-dependent methyltransferase [Candidatus Thiopontia autotrophica]MBL6968714.1 class I SAM-dependent methyltransferase [Gammaproteobacteria bacterium]